MYAAVISSLSLLLFVLCLGCVAKNLIHQAFVCIIKYLDRDQGNSSVGRRFALQKQGPEFDPQKSHEKINVWWLS